MRNFVGSFNCIDKPNMPCGGHLNCKNNDLPSFSASQEPISSTRWKTSKTKRNFLIYNHFTGNHPRIFGNSHEGSYLHKKTGFLTPNGDICRLFAVFYLGMLEDAPPESLEDPSETPPLPTSSRAENLILTPSTGTDLSPRLEFYRSFCSKIILHHKT